MRRRGVSKVVEVMLLIVLGIVLISILAIYLNFQIKDKGEISEIKARLMKENIGITSVDGDMKNPTIITLDLSRGAGQQILIGSNLTDINYSAYNITYVNQTVNKTVEVRWNETEEIEWNETIEVEWNETIEVWWNETINSTTNITSQADIVFIIDSTGSMGDEIADVKNIIINFTQKLEENVSNWRLGLIEFKDYAGSPCGGSGDFPFKIHTFKDGQFTTNASEFRERVSTFSAWGGNDWPESQLTCLNLSLTMNWRPEVKKFDILLTDSPPHAVDCVWSGSVTYASCYFGPMLVANVTLDLVKNNITVFHINKENGGSFPSGGICADRINAENMTDPTGGKYYSYTESQGVEDVLMQIADNVSESVEVIEHSENITVPHVNTTIIPHVNTTVISHSENKTVERVNYTTVEETIEVPVVVEIADYQGTPFDYLKVVFRNETDTYIMNVNFEDLPGPLESKKVSLDVAGKISNIETIEIYPVAFTSDGKEVIGPLLAVWDAENLYSFKPTENYSLWEKIKKMFE
jgi:hypothetical protein